MPDSALTPVLTPAALPRCNLKPLFDDIVRAATIQKRRPKNAANAVFSIMAIELR